MSDLIPAQHEDVACRVIDGAAVLVSPADSSLFWLNPVASRIWQLADGKTSLGQIVETIVKEYEVDVDTARRDAQRMVDAFVEKQLLKAS